MRVNLHGRKVKQPMVLSTFEDEDEDETDQYYASQTISNALADDFLSSNHWKFLWKSDLANMRKNQSSNLRIIRTASNRKSGIWKKIPGIFFLHNLRLRQLKNPCIHRISQIGADCNKEKGEETHINSKRNDVCRPDECWNDYEW